VKDFADFACELADAARVVTLSAAADLASEDKNEGGVFDPVTEADRGAERVMRGLIEKRFPDHGIAGEEYGERPGRSPYRWSIDPIDGTRSFICGLPSWTTLIALLENGQPIVGLIDAPRMGERYLCHGGTTTLITSGHERPIATSGCDRLAEARFSTTDPHLFAGAEHDAFERVRARARLTRYGHDGYAYARLAAGTIDLVIESGLQPYDLQALIPVVRGAGGTIGDWDGGADFAAGRIVAAATRALYEEAVAALRG
jgi:myo-inositol-1(or 4)-monophosphatase